jgi:hypothetical protein
MTFFDENGPYWGDKIAPLTAKGDERLSARSVKIFADGACIFRRVFVKPGYEIWYLIMGFEFPSNCRGVEDWWGCCMWSIFFSGL